MTAPAKPIDIGSLVTRTEGVYGGRPCLEGTRFPILQIAVAYNEGLTPEQVVEQSMDLEISRVYAGFAYYLANKAAVDAELAEATELYHRLAAKQREEIAAGKFPRR
jgi:uncharacterized protein (DUF433 family)